jgi:hypothetical protein
LEWHQYQKSPHFRSPIPTLTKTYPTPRRTNMKNGPPISNVVLCFSVIITLSIYFAMLMHPEMMDEIPRINAYQEFNFFAIDAVLLIYLCICTKDKKNNTANVR